eukprot:c9438_g1_i1.p1 GENE.c9438_g1_i1~~c9438_g1_i1.p1  ORF type:complete len:382 (+),score=88.43 c9438_g1_i1:50-1147(+)
MTKPKVLVLGGLGFIGRNLVQYLVDNELASFIRVVDKAMPITSFLSEAHQAALNSPLVQVKQADLSREASAKKAFELDDGSKFDFVINLAAESKYGQHEQVYEKNILNVAHQVGKAAAAHGCSKFIEISHAGVYEPKSKASDEQGKLAPWTDQARFKLQAEEYLKTLGLPLVILRPAIVYGPADVFGISPRLICAKVYQHENKKMVFLWTSDLKINTVHVHDVVRAIWHACEKLPAGATFNLADKGNTTQGTLNDHLETLFGIKTGFQGMLISQAASLALKSAAEHVNDQHMEPWAAICQDAKIVNTPLTPYLDHELLGSKSMSVEGSAIEATGFSYERPKMTTALVKEQLDLFVEQGLFPKYQQ